MRRIDQSVRIGTTLMLASIVVAQTGCAAGRSGGAGVHAFAHAAEYHVTCSPRSECRIRYLAEDGKVKSATVLGEWRVEVGTDPGARLWLQAAGGGCPPSTIRASIWVDGERRSEDSRSPSPSVRCQWLTAETAYEVP